jgi:hypothetical protein
MLHVVAARVRPSHVVLQVLAQRGMFWFFDKDFSIQHLQSRVIRSNFIWGMPLEGTDNPNTGTMILTRLLISFSGHWES